MATIKFWGDSEIRTNDDSSIDEIVVIQGPTVVHLEQMAADGHWLMVIDRGDENSLYVTLLSDTEIKCTAETNLGEVSVGFKS